MRYPSPYMRKSEARLREILSSVLGECLVGLQYRHSSGDGGQREYEPYRVHEVDMEIVLRFENSVDLVITWAMEGPIQGLDVERLAGATGWATPRVSRDNVTDMPEWKPLTGRRVEEVGVAWHESEEGPEETLWSLRLSFGEAGSVVVALGQVREGRVRYMPDEFIVIFDEDLARSYFSPLGSSAAFGEIFLS